ncbi:MAG: hypothetical protein ABIJ82_00260 [Patescibacteria group bacterium]|nr:hypothetical protein [Patescibacteria group bacterium]MBU1953243.1 hypothetical protein [Patescibacteria group bacterium]
MFKKFILPVLVAFLIGLMVSLTTGAILTPDKAAHLPGGSLSAGFIIGTTWMRSSGRTKILFVIATTCAGLLGWAAYCYFI